MAKPAAEVLKRIEDLLARASDAGATEEERRTSAVIAAKMMREHGITLGVASAPSSPPLEVHHARVQVVIDGARSVVEVAAAGRDGLTKALGFDVFAFAQGLLRDRVQAELEVAIKRAPRPRAKRAKRPK